MRLLRRSLAGILALTLLGGAGGALAGQDSSVTEDVLFEIVVPASAVPDPLKTLYFEAQTVDPGADAVVGADAENMTGRGIYMDSGELLVEPVTDAFLWRQEATLGADPEHVVAGAPVHLTAGDLVLLPTILDTEAVGEAVLRIVNPGSEIAVTYGFHLCGGGGSPAWPGGMGHIPPVGELSTPGRDLAALVSEDALVRLTRTVLAPGSTNRGGAVGAEEDVIFDLYRLETGAIDATFTGERGTVDLSYLPHRPMTFDSNTGWELRVSPEGPASVLSLEGIPVLPPAE